MELIIPLGVEKVGNLVIGEAKTLLGMREKVEEMKGELQWMESFLEDADHRVTSQSQQHQSRLFKEQVSEIREARLDAEDALDTYMVKRALRKRGGVVNRFKRYAYIPKHGIDIHVVVSKIDAVKSRLSTLRERIQTYNIREFKVEDSTSYTTLLPRRSYGHTHDRNVVGLEENINEVVGLLMKEEGEGCKVISIYGMGGLGKTTLAKEVYNDKRVKERFDKFAWVYVSQQFKKTDVWKSTLKQLAFEGDQLNDEQLVEKLHQVQKDHKCIVVLDDIWSIEDWKELRDGFLPEETSLCKIVFTTRKKEVAEHANRRSSYGGLKPLSDNNSLELLRKIALQGRDLDFAEKRAMEDLEKGILKHCRGLPLAIIVIGGVLASKKSLREWQRVHDNINAFLRRGEGHDEGQGLGVHHVLAYSYYDLPLELKTCFLYLCQFPEDYEIKTNILMRMWMAEGFVSVKCEGEGEETMEEVAERYLNELVERCVVEIGERGSTGRIQTCRLHDLMRDVCLSKAKEENLIHSYKKEGPAPQDKIRRLSLIEDVQDGVSVTISLSSYKESSRIRSLILLNRRFFFLSWAALAPVQLARSFRLLKMLFLEGVYTEKGLSKQIGKMIHLKYLSLKGGNIHDWPSLDKLVCMEILDLRVWTVRKKKSTLNLGQIWMMEHLRHLYLPGYGQEYSATGADIMQMESKPNVQTLVNFPPPNCGVEGILKFPNLRRLKIIRRKGSLVLFGLVLRIAESFRIDRLQSLSLTSAFGLPSEPVDLGVVFKRFPHLYKLIFEGPVEKFPPVNQFPTKLTQLELRVTWMEDSKQIETTLGSLPHLTRLLLGARAFEGEQLSFKKGTFLQLQTLVLEGLFKLKSLTVEQGAMPKLEFLRIFFGDNLETVPEGLRFLANLKQLFISRMKAELVARLKEGGSDFDAVKHVPYRVFLALDEYDSAASTTSGGSPRVVLPTPTPEQMATCSSTDSVEISQEMQERMQVQIQEQVKEEVERRLREREEQLTATQATLEAECRLKEREERLEATQATLEEQLKRVNDFMSLYASSMVHFQPDEAGPSKKHFQPDEAGPSKK